MHALSRESWLQAAWACCEVWKRDDGGATPQKQSIVKAVADDGGLDPAAEEGTGVHGDMPYDFDEGARVAEQNSDDDRTECDTVFIPSEAEDM